MVLHGDGPGERWIRAAQPGDRIEGIGPRGKITTSPAADWHLFMGDESALPAIFTMTESLPPADSEATVVLEVPGPEDEQEISAPARTRLTWLHRLDGPAGDPGALRAEAAEVELPPGRGQAYLFGEAKVVPGAARGAGRPRPARRADVAQGLLGPRPRQRQPRRARARRLAHGAMAADLGSILNVDRELGLVRRTVVETSGVIRPSLPNHDRLADFVGAAPRRRERRQTRRHRGRSSATF